MTNNNVAHLVMLTVTLGLLAGCGSGSDNSVVLPPVDPDSSWALSQWKLTLPESKDSYFGSGGSGAAEVIPGGCSLDGSSLNEDLSNDYFWVTEDALHFRVPLNGGVSTPNSSYLRSELRELFTWSPCESNGDAASTWPVSGQHQLSAVLQIDDYVQNTRPKVVVGQIHALDVDQALVKLLWEGYDRPVRVILNQQPGKDSAFSVDLGVVNTDYWSYDITMTATGVIVTAGGVSQTLKFNGVDLSTDWLALQYYFKAGLYPQVDKNNGGVFEASFRQVVINHQ
ncbi:polysaccharide lyase family 7 protein [Agarivorans sp. TSD2052]|uniref:polysaccharide lyase family 7 protein n=1 Tax=Agarivorans sp. TSD2052 TaxID=2937286 RepID=UPI00200E3C2A|nr:polysaccharide lyase family 7 protein [Agarivorans sp. TSD2052]UPW20378.1 polysaccharide lyase family 7 protein [Agarivorans sp. TSD2052]